MTALVYSLLLEDFSSVELKDTRDLLKKHRLRELYFCANRANIVEIGALFGGCTFTTEPFVG